MRPTLPEVLVVSKENVPSSNAAGFLGFTFLVLSEVKCVLGSQVTLKFKCDVANRSRIPNLFQGERTSQKAIGWQRSIVSKGDVGLQYVTQNSSKRCVTLVSKGDVRLCDSQFLTKRVSLRTKCLGYQRWHTTECWRSIHHVYKCNKRHDTSLRNTKSNENTRRPVRLPATTTSQYNF